MLQTHVDPVLLGKVYLHECPAPTLCQSNNLFMSNNATAYHWGHHQASGGKEGYQE